MQALAGVIVLDSWPGDFALTVLCCMNLPTYEGREMGNWVDFKALLLSREIYTKFQIFYILAVAAQRISKGAAPQTQVPCVTTS